MKSRKHIQTQLDQTRIAIGLVLLLLVVSIVLFVRSKPVEAPVLQSDSQETPVPWSCPATAWIRCPSKGGSNDPECEEGFVSWARAKCAGFEGVVFYVSK